MVSARALIILQYYLKYDNANGENANGLGHEIVSAQSDWGKILLSFG